MPRELELQDLELRGQLRYAFGVMDEVESQNGVPGRLEGRDARAERLYSLPNNGLRENDVEAILDIGLPVDNFQRLKRENNDHGREGYLGSWGIGSGNYGEFTLYELNERQIPEHRLGTIAHESAHANTPLEAKNALVFGSEEKRAEAETFARKSAEQAKTTRVFLNGYHAYLYRKLQAGQIDDDTFAEETWAITSELAITNRKKLQQVEDSQHAKLDRLQQAGLIAKREKVFLISKEEENGTVTVRGVDRALISLIDGVKDYAGLKKHVDGLKAKFYPDASLKTAQVRGTAGHTHESPETCPICRQQALIEAITKRKTKTSSRDMDTAPIDVTAEFKSLPINQNAKV